MKIGILTHPLGTNYGGLLQAYALQFVLREMGHDPWIIRRDMDVPFKKKIHHFIKNILLAITMKRVNIDKSRINEFINRISPKTRRIKTSRDLKRLTNKMRFEAYIVGSDQVWRPKYVKPIYNFFLDFSTSQNVKRVSYAASFGVDYWEFSETETMVCKKLIRRFNAVSVRESSGVELCRKKLDFGSICVLDPTMLLPVTHYERLIGQEKDGQLQNKMFCYIFQKSLYSNMVIAELAKLYTFSACELKPTVRKSRLKPSVVLLPSVMDWLQYIRSSGLVITDSFHVCVFCIIFNSPFFVIENEKRGNARIKSLLDKFGLKHRFIGQLPIDPTIAQREVDWETVNNILQKERGESKGFLVKAFNENG